jgi:hypothetical protein
LEREEVAADNLRALVLVLVVKLLRNRASDHIRSDYGNIENEANLSVMGVALVLELIGAAVGDIHLQLFLQQLGARGSSRHTVLKIMRSLRDGLSTHV